MWNPPSLASRPYFSAYEKPSLPPPTCAHACAYAYAEKYGWLARLESTTIYLYSKSLRKCHSQYILDRTTALFIAVISTVIIVITSVVVTNTVTIVTSEMIGVATWVRR